MTTFELLRKLHLIRLDIKHAVPSRGEALRKLDDLVDTIHREGVQPETDT